MNNFRQAEIIAICIGDEILNGQILNSNLQFLGQQCTANGLSLSKEIAIPDDTEIIKQTIENELQGGNKIIITIGGLGATSDDVTRQTLAQMTGREWRIDNDEVERITGFILRRGFTLNKDFVNQQAHLPYPCQKIDNQNGLAVGILLELENNSTIITLPGPPQEFKPMIENEVINWLSNKYGKKQLSIQLFLADTTESQVSTASEKIMANFPNIHIAYCASPCQVRITLIADENFQEEFDAATDALRINFMNNLLPEGCKSLPEALAYLLQKQGKVMATAESCTGGFIAKILTDLAGSSSWFHGGLVTYDNSWKEKLLNVPSDILEEFGAVSEETANAMIDGLLDNYPIQAGIAVTGIAGPGGGTEDKPVGTVFIAAGTSMIRTVKRYQFYGNREAIRWNTANLAMMHLWRILIQEEANLLATNLHC